MYHKTKKSLGQHFLLDKNIANKIVNSFSYNFTKNILEIGSGTGILTSFLVKKEVNLKLIETDSNLYEILQEKFPQLKDRIFNADILQFDLKKLQFDKMLIIGNLPYNISSQIFFKLIDNKDMVDEAVFMIQREVADRICSSPNCKKFGILSVMLQTYFSVEKLFNVSNQVFSPKPKVQSAVIKLRNKNAVVNFDRILHHRLVKTAFNQRRKMMSNSLKVMNLTAEHLKNFATKRPEQLSINDFIELTNLIKKNVI